MGIRRISNVTLQIENRKFQEASSNSKISLLPIVNDAKIGQQKEVLCGLEV
jgi:hypothetical protein